MTPDFVAAWVGAHVVVVLAAVARQVISRATGQ